MPLSCIAALVASAAPLAHTGIAVPWANAVDTSCCNDSNWPLTVASETIAPVWAVIGCVNVPVAAVAVGIALPTCAPVNWPAACAVGNAPVVEVGAVPAAAVGAPGAVGVPAANAPVNPEVPINSVLAICCTWGVIDVPVGNVGVDNKVDIKSTAFLVFVCSGWAYVRAPFCSAVVSGVVAIIFLVLYIF